MGFFCLIIWLVVGLLALDADLKVVDHLRRNYKNDYLVIFENYSHFDLIRMLVIYEMLIKDYKNISDIYLKRMIRRFFIFFTISLTSFIIYSVIFIHWLWTQSANT